MEIVNSLNDTHETQSEIPKVLNQETFDQTWQSFYNHCYFNLQEAEQNIRAGVQGKLASQDNNFSPDNNQDHKNILEQHVNINLNQYIRYMRGIINGGLVVSKEIGKLANFDISKVAEVLEEVNKLPEPEDITIVNSQETK